MAATGTRSQVFIDEVTAEVCKTDMMAPRSSDDHPVKASQALQKAKKWEWPSQSPDCNPMKHVFQLLTTKTEGSD